MKAPKKKLTSNISEERVAGLINDLHEGIASGTVRDWRSVALALMSDTLRLQNHINSIRPTVAEMNCAFAISNAASSEMSKWLERMKQEDDMNEKRGGE